MSSEIVPFGKHKGKPVDALLDDREYLDWLLAQSWFQERYGNIYQIVINNGQEPTETPEHNAMQIKFLDEEYRLKFAFVAKGDRIFKQATNQQIERMLVQFLAEYKRANTDYLQTLSEWKQSNISSLGFPRGAMSRAQAMAVNTNVAGDWAREWDMYKARISEHRAALSTLPKDQQAQYDLEHAPVQPQSAPSEGPSSHEIPELRFEILKARFVPAGFEGLSDFFLVDDPVFEEEGIDVKYEIETGVRSYRQDSSSEASIVRVMADIGRNYSYGRDRGPGEWDGFRFDRSIKIPKLYAKYRFTIEIKPAVGDEYPAILRQMKRNNCDYLLVGRYQGIGATKEQFVQFFELQGIKVIFEEDVQRAELPPCDAEFKSIELPPFDQGEL